MKKTPQAAWVLKLDDKLQVMAWIPLVHARQLEAMVLTDFSEFFSRVAHIQAQIINPENAGLAFGIRLGCAVGRCRKLVLEERRHREHPQLFALRKCYQVEIAQGFFHPCGGFTVNFDERGLGCPRGSGFVNQITR